MLTSGLKNKTRTDYRENEVLPPVTASLSKTKQVWHIGRKIRNIVAGQGKLDRKHKHQMTDITQVIPTHKTQIRGQTEMVQKTNRVNISRHF